MKRLFIWTLGILLVTLPFTWSYLFGFFSGTHHTCIADFDSHKTGLTQHSLTIEESREKKVFIRTLKVDKSQVQLSSSDKVSIKNVWVESSWKYECLDTGLTVISLNKPGVLIELNDYEKFKNNGYQIKHGNEYAGYFSGVLVLFSDVPSADTVSLIITNKDGKETDRLKLTNEKKSTD